MTDPAAPKGKAKTRTKSKAAPKKTAATTKKTGATKKAATAKKTAAPKAKAATKAATEAAAPPKQPVSGEISSFDDSSGTGYVAVGGEWFPLDLSKVEFGDDHFVNWKPGRKVLATIDDNRVESICVDDEYSSD